MLDNKDQGKIFLSSDYDLDIDERKVKYKNFNIVLCEICKNKINHNWYCRNCYDNENNEEKYRMLYGKCKRCFQAMKIRSWCLSCNSKRFEQDFNKWTSGNDEIDKLIKDSQTSSCILEWIPYDRFTDVKFLTEGGFANISSATWIDGRIEKWDQESNNWKRSEPIKVALKVSKVMKESMNPNPSEDFLNELKTLKKFSNYYHTHVIQCYGITREPNSLNYALVLKLKDCSLRDYLHYYYNMLTLKDKLDIIGRICLALDCIHSHNIIHSDLHSGNILYSFKKKSDISISDFVYCKPVNEINSDKMRVYGIMSYMAPEILRYERYTQASDVYSFGIIINEIFSGIQPFHDQSNDFTLALDICHGIRPKIGDETPEPLKKLIQKCWDTIPENRPNTNQIYSMLRDFMYTKRNEDSYDFRKYTNQYKELLRESSYNLEIDTYTSHNTHNSNFLSAPSCIRTKSTMYELSSSRFTGFDECSDCIISN
ncbi:kinase-like domain-containing protein [Rhizophagus irregularis DAOM 181602=DAOM 197198]|uniref:Kinase-like domain-containing protein n=1 Tax=Rhizophagus irregularis (strain DAOM 181602 / DAOM 197198 / MUCL 43194) TaxID=747089 RepID=A0A2P4QKS4_RHIID|nr:kinase-like domain-containing protein [Rhizophagus irregularis DAOM 181602=DAOM 197198]POG78252.1 kinase-like domain-containing protein [Rhizophagus irregularis DAOM 181602=DAOM 197198]GBC23642.2 kinase-like domain-containing protein [Rhizophagus irregularis DAOM 181602=DAOM 197198]|eukprot:XP_025185118.1 kinase-like domain-containing protein [Rhizophagus irregularis DAOM 181602=DAOM 197198]